MKTKLSLEDIQSRADFLYSEMRDAEGRPQRMKYGIESSQVKAMLQALVEGINELVEGNTTG